MSATPGAVLARLKVAYPGWKITRSPSGVTATQRDSGRQISAASPLALDYELTGFHPSPTRRAGDWLR